MNPLIKPIQIEVYQNSFFRVHPTAVDLYFLCNTDDSIYAVDKVVALNKGKTIHTQDEFSRIDDSTTPVLNVSNHA